MIASVIYNKACGRDQRSHIKPAHIRLDEFTKSDFHIDTVGAFSNFYARDFRKRIAQSGTRVFLRRNGGRSESEEQNHKRYCRMDAHRCGGLRPFLMRGVGHSAFVILGVMH